MSEQADFDDFLEATDESVSTLEDTQDRILAALIRLEAGMKHLENRIDLLHDQVVDGFRTRDLRIKQLEANGHGRYKVVGADPT